VLSKRVKWLSFHSGYDFGYMVKMLTNSRLPDSDEEFFSVLNEYFPYIYDVKYMMKSCRSLKGGLQELATNLEIQRKGPQHTAGSDSLMTGEAFFKLKSLFFEGSIDDNAFCGHLYGFSAGYNNSSPAAVAAALSSAAGVVKETNNTAATDKVAALSVSDNAAKLEKKEGAKEKEKENGSASIKEVKETKDVTINGGGTTASSSSESENPAARIADQAACSGTDTPAATGGSCTPALATDGCGSGSETGGGGSQQ